MNVPKVSRPSELKDLVKILLRHEDLDGDIDVVPMGTSEKGDGYLSDIIFVEVNGKTSKNEKRHYQLALKCGKKDANLRDLMPIKETFENEIYVYKTIIPTFQKYLKERSQPEFESVARCYSTMIIEGIEYIGLQNLKKNGYDLHNRKISMDKNHHRLTLEAYGKWHAISFALKDQNRGLFDKISNLNCIWRFFCKSDKLNFIKKQEDAICETLENNQKLELLKMFKQKYSPCYENWFNLVCMEEPQSVISHGDCWNNNFLFCYEPEDTEKQNPTKVVMLDFQLSRLASPVFDLSYHLYAVASAKDLANLKGLLHIYYASLADNIRKLGSDPDKLFPYESLIKHWKKYHLVGLLIAGLVLPVTLVDKEDTMNIEDMNKHSIDDIMTRMVSKTKENLDKRIIDLVRHAVTYEL